MFTSPPQVEHEPPPPRTSSPEARPVVICGKWWMKHQIEGEFGCIYLQWLLLWTPCSDLVKGESLPTSSLRWPRQWPLPLSPSALSSTTTKPEAMFICLVFKPYQSIVEGKNNMLTGFVNFRFCPLWNICFWNNLFICHKHGIGSRKVFETNDQIKQLLTGNNVNFCIVALFTIHLSNKITFGLRLLYLLQ